MFKPDPVQAELAQLAAVVKEFKDGQYTTNDIDKYIKERNEKLEPVSYTHLDVYKRQAVSYIVVAYGNMHMWHHLSLIGME